MKRRSKGIVFLCLGAALLLCAGGWYLALQAEDDAAGRQAAAVLTAWDTAPTERSTEHAETVLVAGNDRFCGKLTVDALGLTLPVHSEWDYARLKTAPCRYVGTARAGNMVIAAHNYDSHFGRLRRLTVGDAVTFKDVDGTVYRYTVKEVVTLDGTAVEDMRAGEWDLTLFTCTKSGKQRVTVRCEQE